MSSVWGRNIKISLFGESHGAAVGMSMSGLPAGFEPDLEKIRAEMKRRAPGLNELSSARKESDSFEIISGIFRGRTTGSPLCILIRNENAESSAYVQGIVRPSHADLSAYHKYGGYADFRGGGHFSARLTAPLVFAGAAAKQVLEKENIRIGARIKSIGTVCDADADAEEIISASKKDFPVLSSGAEEEMKKEIMSAKNSRDSVGGIIECAAAGINPGLGEPFFDSLESSIASMMFSVPAVKAVEFGAGFALSAMRGSASNDQMSTDGEKIIYRSNNGGGIEGGISNGQPIIFRAGIKPAASIGTVQSSVDITKMETVMISAEGRHDPCIVLRAVPVIEAGTALCLLDFLHDRF